MTRAVRDRILKDVNGNISDHLRNHIHLTNCIHLKNHMHHKHSPILSDRSLMRDLVVLQRSRSLRDPSASPPSPSAIDILLKRVENDDFVGGRRSISIEKSPMQVSRHNEGSRNAIRERRKAKIEELSGPQDGNDVEKSRGGGTRHDRRLKTLSDQLKDVRGESDEASSHKVRHESNLNRGKRRKFRGGGRRNRSSIASHRDIETQNEMSVASNSYAQGRVPRKYHMEEEGVYEHDDHNVSGGPRNGCGIPWNWSRIHHRGKSFLSCGLSESRSKKGGRGMDMPDMPVMSEHSSSSTKSEGEALPLLLEASGSQGSIDRTAWLHDYSGELGIYADNLLRQETDSDLASEGRSGGQRKFHKHPNERHQNLTQKYTPRTFRDLVGQSLVVQALSNAIMRRKVGLLYLFYGPHGTGKTSCARIFARALNCQSQEHPKPCGSCSSCIAQNTGKSRHIREVGPVSNIDLESVIELLDNVIASSSRQSLYRVFIFDECDTLSSECWSAILKVTDRSPRRIVFVLVCSSLDALPHIIISRCQKFYFPKLKDADIIYTLQWISTKEDLDIDKDALKLIASRSDGSLRDAEMTLEQLSLLGKRITLSLVQELVGLISDEKLIDLLDLALSADTVNTVKNLRDIMESGVEPLALMSQLATVITDILAGSYDFMKERSRRKFFRRQTLSKEDMEKLRQALKTLSEAEKQLRVSNDRITWLTAALLQLAPDQQYMLPSTSADSSFHQSPLVVNNGSLREMPRKSNADTAPRKSNADVAMFQAGPSGQVYKGRSQGMVNEEIEEIWSEVLEKIPFNSIKEFMFREGKLISVSYGAAPTVQLLFSSPPAKSKAERFRLHILQAFESVLRSPVTIEIRCESRKDIAVGPLLLPATHDLSRLDVDPTTQTHHDDIKRREIVEIEASPRDYKGIRHKDENIDNGVGAASSKLGERNQSLSLVRGKVSLAHVIQQAEGSQHSGWSKRKAVSIAEKLEHENLRLEPKSRGLLCWNPPKVTRRKLSRLKIRTRRPQTLLKFVSCGRCLSGRSPR